MDYLKTKRFLLTMLILGLGILLFLFVLPWLSISIGFLSKLLDPNNPYLNSIFNITNMFFKIAFNVFIKIIRLIIFVMPFIGISYLLNMTLDIFYTTLETIEGGTVFKCSLWKIAQESGTSEKLLDVEQSYVVYVMVIDNIIGLAFSTDITTEEKDTEKAINNETTITRKIDYYTFDEASKNINPYNNINSTLENRFKIAANKQLYFNRQTEESTDDKPDKTWHYNGIFSNDAFYEISYGEENTERSPGTDSKTENIYLYKKSYDNSKEELVWQIKGQELQDKYYLEAPLIPFNYDDEWLYLQATRIESLNEDRSVNEHKDISILYRLSKSGDKFEKITNSPNNGLPFILYSPYATFFPNINIANDYFYYVDKELFLQNIKIEAEPMD